MFERTGLFRVSGVGEDWDLFLRMTEETRAANLPQILCYNRMHSGSSNVQHSPTVRLRYAHARESAERRAKGSPEGTFEDFCERDSRRPAWGRFADELDQMAAIQYRRASDDSCRRSNQGLWSTRASISSGAPASDSAGNSSSKVAFHS